jgi:hypothetical protein
MIKPIKKTFAALGIAAMACLTPTPSQGETVQLISSDYTYSNNGYIEGAAQTSGSKLGLGGKIRIFANDLSSSSDMVTPVANINDAGSWDDNYTIVHNGGSGVTKVDLSTGYGVGSSSVSGTGVEGISSIFQYNGKDHFAAIDAHDDTIKFFEWGNQTPVATGPNVGSNYTGLEVIANGPVTDLSKIPILVSRDFTDGAGNLDQYFDGQLVGEYQAGGSDTLTDISYNSGSGILTTSFKGGRARGGMVNYDFASHVVPEPGTAALIGLAALGAYAVRRLRM